MVNCNAPILHPVPGPARPSRILIPFLVPHCSRRVHRRRDLFLKYSRALLTRAEPLDVLCL